ncbi:MAG TPA: penicillin-binding protein 1C [Polyangiaceae bacterium]|jgi:penicillin-binding protein 1C|nr:penicillin-binding protein 1C [Polyangiaceae bacterium]
MRRLGLREWALRRPWRTALVAAFVLVALPVVAVVVTAVFTPLPPVLVARTTRGSTVVVDRSGSVLREVRTEDSELSVRVRLGELAPSVVPALIAAEDSRFYLHPGVDPLAIGRAFAGAVRAGHVVSGASTITQQVARTLFVRPRTMGGKFREMALALRLEWSLDKARILEEYLSRVEFGPGLRGIEAASRFYLDKPASKLDLAESAELVALVRGPSLYDPRRRAELVKRRRDRVLARMERRGLAGAAETALAALEPVRVAPRLFDAGAPHLALELAAGAIPAGAARGALARIETTLDAPLQREVETLTRRALSDVAAMNVTALAAIVVDNASGDVLAYVGSPDYFSARTGGANDGVRALRQPGSTLKPFVYAAAMESLGVTAATLLPDVELTFETENGPYTPKNYDGRTHGPVRLRQALGSSLNIPAVDTAARVGPPRVLDVLHRVGFASLGASAERYGAALALGDGEVRLGELAEAYATLARGGVHSPLVLVRDAVRADGARVELPSVAPSRALDARTVAVLTDVLADDGARAASFGRDSALALPFPVAAKTGTSKGYRDNWAVGFTHEVTVAVWAGNFDGSPMLGSSGITGAAPLFHDVMLAAMRGREPAPLVDRTGLVDVEVCALSGSLPGRACSHRVHELFRPEQAPRSECTLHVHAAVDPENGLLAGPGCGSAVEKTFETYPPRYVAWASAAGRPLLPDVYSPRCPSSLPAKLASSATPHAGSATPRIRFPRDGSRFVVDHGGPALQEIVLAAQPGADARPLRFVLDGHALATVAAPFELPWTLTAGRHRFAIETTHGEGTAAVTFEVADSR